MAHEVSMRLKTSVRRYSWWYLNRCSITDAFTNTGHIPSSRESLTLTKSFSDRLTLIHISTSIPVTKHDPAYLRPSSEHLRANIGISAFCVQTIGSTSASSSAPRKLRLTHFWSWDPQGPWTMGGSSGTPLYLASSIAKLCRMVANPATAVASLSSFGDGIVIDGVGFDVPRSALTLRYSLAHDEFGTGNATESDREINAGISETSDIDNGHENRNIDSKASDLESSNEGIQAISAVMRRGNRNRRGNRRALEISLTPGHSWDVQLQGGSNSGSSPGELPGWVSKVEKLMLDGEESIDKGSNLKLQLKYTGEIPEQSVDRYVMFVEKTSGDRSTVRINGRPIPIEPISLRSRRMILSPSKLANRATSDYSASGYRHLIPGDDVALGLGGDSGSILTTPSMDDIDIGDDGDAQSAGLSSSEPIPRNPSYGQGDNPGRLGPEVRRIKSLIERNYIYFTSLLQQPPAKWRPLKDSRGVALHRLDSIDPTVVVFRAESILVNVSIWDVYSIIKTLGSKAWDKTLLQAVLLEHVGGQSEVWYERHKSAWPVSAHDSVTLNTTYQSADAIHLFAFSVNDRHMFPSLPVVTDPTLPRANTVIKGFSLEQLSPNTVQVTLVERTDPGQWATKNTVPQLMMAALASVGDLAIKGRAPPAVARSQNALMRGWYLDGPENERFVVEYLAKLADGDPLARLDDYFRSNTSVASTDSDVPRRTRHRREASEVPSIAAKALNDPDRSLCEIRLGGQPWISGCEVVVDPPPISWAAKKRSKSSGGGITLHVMHKLTRGEQPYLVRILIRGIKDGNAYTINGESLRLEAETSLPPALRRMKRAPPSRQMLDQISETPRTASVRGRPESIRGLADDKVERREPSPPPPMSSTPRPFWQMISDPITRAYTITLETTKSVTGIASLAAPEDPISVPGPKVALMKALAQLQRLHADRSHESTAADPWTTVSNGSDIVVERRLIPYLSDRLPTFRTSRIIQGSTAEDVLALVANHPHRWDDRQSSYIPLSSHGSSVKSSFQSLKLAYPFQERSCHLASGSAQGEVDHKSVSETASTGKVLFYASTSRYQHSLSVLDSNKYAKLAPSCNVILEGWILETLDPYAHDRYEIPSTRCFHFSVTDFGVPVAMNNILNATLPRRVLGLEKALKGLPPTSRVLFPPAIIDLQVDSPVGTTATEDSDSKTTAEHSATLVDTHKSAETGTLFDIFIPAQVFAAQSNHDSRPPTPQESESNLESSSASLSRKSGRQWNSLPKAIALECSFSIDPANEQADFTVQTKLASPLEIPDKLLYPISFEDSGNIIDAPVKCLVWRCSDTSLTASLTDQPARSLLLAQIHVPLPRPVANHPLGGVGVAIETDPEWLIEARKSGFFMRIGLKNTPSTVKECVTLNGELQALQESARSPQSLENERVSQTFLRSALSATASDSDLAGESSRRAPPFFVNGKYLKDQDGGSTVDIETRDSKESDSQPVVEEDKGHMPTIESPLSLSLPLPTTPTPTSTQSSNFYNFWPLPTMRSRRSDTLPAPATPDSVPTSTDKETIATEPDAVLSMNEISTGVQQAATAIISHAQDRVRPITSPFTITFIVALSVICVLLGWTLRPVIQDLDTFAVFSGHNGSGVEVIPILKILGWEVVVRKVQ